MKLSPGERADRRASFKKMRLPQKLSYVFSYYKLPLTLTLVALLVLGDFLWRAATAKEVPLYTAYLNVTVGEELGAALETGYVASLGADPAKTEVSVYRDLYLVKDPSAENHQYVYATRMKLMASILAKELDAVVMNREAYDILSGDGYLMELPSLLAQDGALLSQAEPYLTENTVILEDNSIEFSLNEAGAYEAVTRQSVNALALSSLPLFENAGFDGPIYLGVVANTPRQSAVCQYISYLLSAGT